MSWPGIRCIGHTPSYSSTSRPPFRTITFAVKQQTAGNLLMNSLCRILLTHPWTPWRARPCRRDSRNCPHWSRTFLAASRNVLNDYSQHSVPLDTKFSLVARGYLAASCAMDNRLFRASGAPPSFEDCQQSKRQKGEMVPPNVSGRIEQQARSCKGRQRLRMTTRRYVMVCIRNLGAPL